MTPGFDRSTMLLLTDGSVMFQKKEPRRFELEEVIPDAAWSYVTANLGETWATPMHLPFVYYGLRCLGADGRVLSEVGETVLGRPAKPIRQNIWTRSTDYLDRKFRGPAGMDKNRLGKPHAQFFPMAVFSWG